MELAGQKHSSSRLWIVCVVIVVAGLAIGVAYMRHVQAIENAKLRESLEMSERMVERDEEARRERLKAVGVEVDDK